MNFIYYFFIICEASWLPRASTGVGRAQGGGRGVEDGDGDPPGMPRGEEEARAGWRSCVWHTPGGADPRCSGVLCCLWSQRNREGDTAQLMAKGDTPGPNPKLGFFPPPGACFTKSWPCHPAVDLEPHLGLCIMALGSFGNGLCTAPGAAGRVWEPCCVGTASPEGDGILAFLFSMHYYHSG